MSISALCLRLYQALCLYGSLTGAGEKPLARLDPWTPGGSHLKASASGAPGRSIQNERQCAWHSISTNGQHSWLSYLPLYPPST